MGRSKPRAGVLAVLLAAGAAAQSPLARAIAARITANSLRADVSFLASDVLEGRGTPSRGLDIAAEYIAAEFRRAGLEPAGDEGYFQNASYAQVTPSGEALELTIETAGDSVRAGSRSMIQQEAGSASLAHASSYLADLGDAAATGQLTAAQIRGKVLILTTPAAGSAMAAGRRRRAVPELAQRLEPALVIVLREAAQAANPNPRLRETATPAAPILVVWDSAFRAALAGAKPGPLEVTVSARVPAPSSVPVRLRNVVGVLRGADPALRGTYVLLTAHYDHLGIRGSGDGDHIFNGANDDASGTASVIEIASALASLTPRPRRSIVFMALFGEELGELGSHYYARHPVFPLARTVADINLEQLGRTDDANGPRIGQFNLTGFDFTNLAGYFRKAGAQTGIRVVKDPQNSDPYFTRSDNAAFAEAGVPSTTLSVAYDFPDYHRVGDKWPKLDYANMARVDRTVALAMCDITAGGRPPAWNQANPKTAAYVAARANAGSR